MYMQIRLPLSCLVIVALCFYYYRGKKQLPTRTARVFHSLACASLAHLVAATVTEYTVNNRDRVPEAFNYIWHIAFFLSLTLVSAAMLYYLILYIERGTGRQARGEKTALLIALLVGMASQVFASITYVDTAEGSYSLGPKAYALYIYLVYILFRILYNLVRYRKVIEREKSRVLFVSAFIFILIFGVQAFRPHLLLTSVGVTMVTLSIMINTEDAHLYVSYKNDRFNELGCREIIQENLIDGKPFRVGAYAFVGSDEAVERAAAGVELRLREKRGVMCGALADNLLLVLPLQTWTGKSKMIDVLPEPSGAALQYRSKFFDFTGRESAEEVEGTIRAWRSGYEAELLQRDELTGLLRRGAFVRQVDRLVEDRIPFSLVMLDLDDFKSINDTYGHNVGDDVLRFTADLFRASLRSSDVLGRMGGDEFIILLRGTTDERRIRETVGRILAGMQEGCLLPGGERTVSMSAGVRIYRAREDVSFEELYTAADAALYEAKGKGKQGMAFAPEERADKEI